MYILKSDRTLFVDVDDTLVIWEGHSYKPHEGHIELVKKFHNRGQPVVIWSAGGWEWALRIVDELGLQDYVTAVMSKPAWFIDDLPASEFLPEGNRIYLEPVKVDSATAGLYRTYNSPFYNPAINLGGPSPMGNSCCQWPGTNLDPNESLSSEVTCCQAEGK